jgi:cytoskeletal protein RodZ
MVNKIVLEYFKTHKDKYKLEDLKKKALDSGYSKKDIDEAIAQLSESEFPDKPKKSRKWLWISLGILLFILILGGAALWYFWDKIFPSIG